ncbi:paraslipin [Thiospirochaeta perfilievii]|uniref:Paraslipin n=1 Tax=Thiospirochaeta perfilievii TaxID=252967 RepID=A0A5C1QF03_9SPIO|nr:stomatin-like protein [Thiospirochaeta perfilievii]QEN04802.1 paraslipin [Thiospirochaeta perfilievii]
MFLSFLLAIVVIYILIKTFVIVPQENAWVIENLGKYKKTLGPGLHIVIPVIQKVAYKHTLKEEVIDVPPQICITKDNVQLKIDGILYLKVMDPNKASYGIDNYRFATAQLAQTTLRSEIGKISLDKTFSEREDINAAVVKSVDIASDPWGIKVTRYEIKDIDPPITIQNAMEQQMTAEREKRADILESDGIKKAQINQSMGEKQEAINYSLGEKQSKVNRAVGKAKAIEIVAQAQSEGLKIVGEAINKTNGKTAMQMRIVQQYIGELETIISNSETTVLPLPEAELNSILQTILPAIKGGKN